MIVVVIVVVVVVVKIIVTTLYVIITNTIVWLTSNAIIISLAAASAPPPPVRHTTSNASRDDTLRPSGSSVSDASGIMIERARTFQRRRGPCKGEGPHWVAQSMAPQGLAHSCKHARPSEVPTDKVWPKASTRREAGLQNRNRENVNEKITSCEAVRCPSASMRSSVSMLSRLAALPSRLAANRLALESVFRVTVGFWRENLEKWVRTLGALSSQILSNSTMRWE